MHGGHHKQRLNPNRPVADNSNSRRCNYIHRSFRVITKYHLCTQETHQIHRQIIQWELPMQITGPLASYLHRQIAGFCEQKKTENRHTLYNKTVWCSSHSRACHGKYFKSAALSKSTKCANNARFKGKRWELYIIKPFSHHWPDYEECNNYLSNTKRGLLLKQSS